jgi:hypothetical protein
MRRQVMADGNGLAEGRVPAWLPGEPAVEVTLTIKLSGALANVEDISEIAARMDEVLAARYPKVYGGPSIRLTTDPLPATPPTV